MTPPALTFFTRSLRIRHTHTHNWQEWKAIRSIYYTDICLFLIHIKFLIYFIFLPSSSLHETRRRSLSWKRCWDGDDSLTSWRTRRRSFRFSGACVPAVSVKLVWGRCYHRYTECAPESTSKIYFLLYFLLFFWAHKVTFSCRTCVKAAVTVNSPHHVLLKENHLY